MHAGADTVVLCWLKNAKEIINCDFSFSLPSSSARHDRARWVLIRRQQPALGRDKRRYNNNFWFHVGSVPYVRGLLLLACYVVDLCGRVDDKLARKKPCCPSHILDKKNDSGENIGKYRAISCQWKGRGFIQEGSSLPCRNRAWWAELISMGIITECTNRSYSCIHTINQSHFFLEKVDYSEEVGLFS